MDFSTKLARLIEGPGGFSKAQVAEATEVSQTTVQRWIIGESTPSITHIKKLSLLTGLPVSFLADDDVESAPDFEESPQSDTEVMSGPPDPREDKEDQMIKMLVDTLGKKEAIARLTSNDRSLAKRTYETLANFLWSLTPSGYADERAKRDDRRAEFRALMAKMDETRVMRDQLFDDLFELIRLQRESAEIKPPLTWRNADDHPATLAIIDSNVAASLPDQDQPAPAPKKRTPRKPKPKAE